MTRLRHLARSTPFKVGELLCGVALIAGASIAVGHFVQVSRVCLSGTGGVARQVVPSVDSACMSSYLYSIAGLAVGFLGCMLAAGGFLGLRTRRAAHPGMDPTGLPVGAPVPAMATLAGPPPGYGGLPEGAPTAPGPRVVPPTPTLRTTVVAGTLPPPPPPSVSPAPGAGSAAPHHPIPSSLPEPSPKKLKGTIPVPAYRPSAGVADRDGAPPPSPAADPDTEARPDKPRLKGRLSPTTEHDPDTTS